MLYAKAVNQKIWRNGSRAVECQPEEFLRPSSLDALRTAVLEAAARGRTVRVVGRGHSLTPLCATDGVMVSLENLRGVIALDEEKREAGMWAGSRLDELGRELARQRLAMENLGDIGRQTIGGAISTGTHGTGAGFGTLSTQVVGLTLVTARGEVRELSPSHEPEVFRAAQTSLGSLGVLVQVRLRLLPAYRLHLERRNLSLDECLAGLDVARTCNRHYEFSWFPHTDRVLTKAMNVTDALPRRGASVGRFVEELVLENAFMGLASQVCRRQPSWCAPVSRLASRLVKEGRVADESHALFASPHLVRFQEMEYAIPVQRGPDCLRELREFIDRQRIPVHLPLECRFVRGDDIPLSPAYGRDSAFIAVHQHQGMAMKPYFDGAEAIFRNHGGRPHWGKLHTQTAATLRSLYPRWDEFQRVRRELDPNGCFLNPYLRLLLEG